MGRRPRAHRQPMSPVGGPSNMLNGGRWVGRRSKREGWTFVDLGPLPGPIGQRLSSTREAQPAAEPILWVSPPPLACGPSGRTIWSLSLLTVCDWTMVVAAACGSAMVDLVGGRTRGATGQAGCRRDERPHQQAAGKDLGLELRGLLGGDEVQRQGVALDVVFAAGLAHDQPDDGAGAEEMAFDVVLILGGQAQLELAFGAAEQGEELLPPRTSRPRRRCLRSPDRSGSGSSVSSCVSPSHRAQGPTSAVCRAV